MGNSKSAAAKPPQPEKIKATGRHDIPKPPPIDRVKQEALISAVAAKDAEALRKLMGSPGVSLTALGRAGWSPLHVACQSGDPAMIQILLEADVEPNTASSSVTGLKSPLHLVLKQPALRDALLGAEGINVLQEDKTRTSPLLALAREQAPLGLFIPLLRPPLQVHTAVGYTVLRGRVSTSELSQLQKVVTELINHRLYDHIGALLDAGAPASVLAPLPPLLTAGGQHALLLRCLTHVGVEGKALPREKLMRYGIHPPPLAGVHPVKEHVSSHCFLLALASREVHCVRLALQMGLQVHPAFPNLVWRDLVVDPGSRPPAWALDLLSPVLRVEERADTPEELRSPNTLAAVTLLNTAAWLNKANLWTFAAHPAYLATVLGVWRQLSHKRRCAGRGSLRQAASTAGWRLRRQMVVSRVRRRALR